MAVIALFVGCGGEPADAPGGSVPEPVVTQDLPLPRSQDPTTAPACDETCRGVREAARAERRERERERCAALVPQVHLEWRITATPTDAGQQIGLRIVVVNRSDMRLSGDTWGVLRTSAGPAQEIRWGGSSADVVWQRPDTTTDREVWHERRPPGWHPVARRVTSFSYDAYTYAPGRPTLVCHLPAVVRSPPGLVDGHPSGRWTQRPAP